jgi:DNA-binding transcriptional MerR regulator
VCDVAHEDDHRLTIDELAQRAGMTVRNIRAHQSRGLLPAPEVRGRTGYYGPEHIARLELIAEMQADGFNLAAIKRLVDEQGRTDREFLGFRRALMEPFADEEPEVVDAGELIEVWGQQDPRLVRKAERLGLIRDLGEGRFEVPSPRLQRAGRELAELGIPADTALRVMERLKRHSEGVANAFVKLFLETVWRPFEDAGYPEDQWPEVRRALDRLRPLASESLLAVFQLTMTQAVEEAFGKELRRTLKKRS